MVNLKSWISALRPRTLFLCISGTTIGNGLAYSIGLFDYKICLLSILTATFLQLLSNLANDLGDYQHGTDITGERVGPTRAVQSGRITPGQMKNAILIVIACAAICGILLIYSVLVRISFIYIIILFILGGLAIVAAIKYTAGNNPYGYKGLGDLAAFLFFGPIAIVGTYFMQTCYMNFQPWLPSIAIGCFTAAVLNVNNMRDMENDRNCGKMTLAIRLGLSKAKLYHALLTCIAIICFISYSLIYNTHWYQYLYMICFIPFILILIKIYKTTENKLLDPYLKYTSLSTFVIALVFVICINM